MTGFSTIKFEDIINKDLIHVELDLVGSSSATSANYGTFYIARSPVEVVEVKARWNANSSSGTLMVERLSNGDALGAGDNVLTSTISTSSGAQTVVSRTKEQLQNTVLQENQALSLEAGGTLTGITSLSVVVYLRPLGKGDYR